MAKESKDNKKQTTESQENRKFWIQTILSAAAIFLVVIFLRTYVISNDRVSGPSMQPTFEDGDRLIAAKHSEIKRNDIVIVDAPDEPGSLYIKRVIGLPGETVESKNDTLYINGKKVNQPYLNNSLKRDWKDETGYLYTNNFTLKTLSNSKEWRKNHWKKATGPDHNRVPKGYYFVMGDHRSVSKDSRMIGFIKKTKINGVVKWRYWPINKSQLYLN